MLNDGTGPCISGLV